MQERDSAPGLRGLIEKLALGDKPAGRLLNELFFSGQYLMDVIGDGYDEFDPDGHQTLHAVRLLAMHNGQIISFFTNFDDALSTREAEEEKKIKEFVDREGDSYPEMASLVETDEEGILEIIKEAGLQVICAVALVEMADSHKEFFQVFFPKELAEDPEFDDDVNNEAGVGIAINLMKRDQFNLADSIIIRSSVDPSQT